MAGDAIVGALRVVLGMDTGAFEDGAKKAGKQVQSFGQQVSAIASGIGLEKAFEKFFSFVEEGFNKALDTAEKFNVASQKFGLPVEKLSELGLVAEKSHVSMESLGEAFQTLAKNAETTAGKQINAASAAFKAMGISVTDASGNLKDQLTLFNEIADKFAGYTDGTNKAALAQAIFRGNGADLIPILNKGSQGIAAETEEFRKLGLVVSTDAVAAASAFKDQLFVMGKTTDAIFIKIAQGLTPAMTDLAKQLQGSANDGDAWVKVGEAMGTTLKFIADWASIAAQAFSILLSPWKAVFQAAMAIASGDFSGAVKALTPDTTALSEAFLKLGASIRDALTPVDPWEKAMAALADSMANLEQKLINIKQQPPPFSEKQAQLAKEFADELQKLGAQANTLRGNFGGLAPGFAEAAVHFKDMAGFGYTFGQTVDQLSPKAAQLNAQLQQLAQAQVFANNLDPLQKYNLAMDDLTRKFPAAAQASQEFTRQATKNFLDLATAIGDQAKSMVTGWAEAFKILAEKNKEFAGIAKGLAIAEALINTYLAATKALASGFPPFNYIAAAGVVAAGLANVAKISATQFAQGGSFVVGGSGGIDSQLVQFRATPGESVDVRTPAQQARGQNEITVRGMAPDDVFTGKWLRSFVDALNAGDRDGYRLKFAER